MAERASWGNFPPIIRNGDLGELQKQPEYAMAKGGDTEAAQDIAERLVRVDLLDQIQHLIGSERPRIVPVLAEEASGRNKIPLAMAFTVGEKLGLDVDVSIYQQERVARTGEGADYRLAFNPSFGGPVIEGQSYLVFDDTLTMGGTIASLRGFLENRGGKVMAGAVMTAHPGALNIAIKPGMIHAINQKHGAAMDDFWKETFGYGIDQLTQGEAGHLRKSPSVDAIRTRIFEARHAVFSQANERTLIGKTVREQGRQADRVTEEIPRPLQPYHQVINKLESISAPAHEVLVAQRKLAIAEEFYDSGMLDVPGALSSQIRERAHKEALLIMTQSRRSQDVLMSDKPSPRKEKAAKMRTGPEIDM